MINLTNEFSAITDKITFLHDIIFKNLNIFYNNCLLMFGYEWYDQGVTQLDRNAWRKEGSLLKLDLL